MCCRSEAAENEHEQTFGPSTRLALPNKKGQIFVVLAMVGARISLRAET
jgi:hypothetical protein